MKVYDCKFCQHFYATGESGRIGKCELKKVVNCYNDNWKTGLCESDYYEINNQCECADYKTNCHGRTGLYLLYREYIKRDEAIIAYKNFNKVIVDGKTRYYDEEARYYDEGERTYKHCFYFAGEEYKTEKTFYCNEYETDSNSQVKIWGEIKRENGKIQAEYMKII